MARYLGEIRLFAGNYAPAEWMMCNGQLLSIADYKTLFQLIGTTYGGDGDTTFALPDLRSRAPMHRGPQFVLGKADGVEQVALDIEQIPSHDHQASADPGPATTNTPANTLLLSQSTAPLLMYAEQPVNLERLEASAISTAGGSQPHTNLQPYLALNFIIAVIGIYPAPPSATEE